MEIDLKDRHREGRRDITSHVHTAQKEKREFLNKEVRERKAELDVWDTTETPYDRV